MHALLFSVGAVKLLTEGSRVGGVVSILTTLRDVGEAGQEQGWVVPLFGREELPSPRENCQENRDASAQGSILSFTGSHSRHGRGC